MVLFLSHDLITFCFTSIFDIFAVTSVEDQHNIMMNDVVIHICCYFVLVFIPSGPIY